MLELPRFRGSSEICVMEKNGYVTEWRENMPFGPDCAARFALNAISPCYTESHRRKCFTQISEEPVSWTVKDYAT